MSRRILVVEDDPGLARILCDNLKVDGFVVKWASTAHQALTFCQSFTPDLVLLDVMLPERDGFELCGVLRQGGRPVVVTELRDWNLRPVRRISRLSFVSGAVL